MDEKKYSASTEMLLKAASKLKINVDIIDNDNNFFLFSKDSKELYVRNSIVETNNYLSSKVVENKELTKVILKKSKVKVPNGIVCHSFKDCLRHLDDKKISYPLVVKPIDGSQGKAVTPAIEGRKMLKIAIKDVLRYLRKYRKPSQRSFIVEEYIAGEDYRFLVLDGKLISVLNRKPAYVVGDGKSTIRDLINKYNDQDNIGKKKVHCPIPIDHEAKRNLALVKRSMSSVPNKEETVYLRKNANVSTGGRAFEIINTVHEEYKKLAVNIASILHLRFCAVDLIIADPKDISNYSVIEVNSLPGFDINEIPYVGKGVPVSEMLLKSLFGI